jgi:hypothetical protein
MDNSNSTAVTFNVGTDGTGNIDSWQLDLQISSLALRILTLEIPATESTIDESCNQSCSINVALNQSAGTWQASTATAPEPTTFLLLGTGLLGFGAVVLRRKQIA